MMAAGLDQVGAFCGRHLHQQPRTRPGRSRRDVRPVSTSGKFIGVLAMLLGRLEIFTVLVILAPAFWRD